MEFCSISEQLKGKVQIAFIKLKDEKNQVLETPKLNLSV